jgi:hypothetical protein
MYRTTLSNNIVSLHYMSKTTLSKIQFILFFYLPRNLNHVDSSLVDFSFLAVKVMVETIELWQILQHGAFQLVE